MRSVVQGSAGTLLLPDSYRQRQAMGEGLRRLAQRVCVQLVVIFFSSIATGKVVNTPVSNPSLMFLLATPIKLTGSTKRKDKEIETLNRKRKGINTGGRNKRREQERI